VLCGAAAGGLAALQNARRSADHNQATMQATRDEKRREPRFAIQAGTLVGVRRGDKTVKAVTINMSGCGVLLQLSEPVELVVGDTVVCDFDLPNEAGALLPYWAEGSVVRLDENRIAIDFHCGGWTQPKAASSGEAP
jgi:hypothetical protein